MYTPLLPSSKKPMSTSGAVTPASFAVAATLTLLLMAATAAYIPAPALRANATVQAESMTATVLPTVHVVASR